MPAAVAPGVADAASNANEAEHLIPPQGGAATVPVHAGTVCILSFPEKLASQALGSSKDFEIMPWNNGMAVRALHSKVPAATLALATASGNVKVNVTLRVVPASEPALTLVRFKAASAKEAFDAQMAVELKKQMEPLRAALAVERQGLAAERKELDATIRRKAEELIADRLLSRNEVVTIAAHERNADHVIAHVKRGLLFGDDGYVIFEIQNRSGAAFRLASVRVFADGRRNVAGAAKLKSTAIERDPALVGIVPSGATNRGIVTVRSADAVANRPLVLELVTPDGRGNIRIERGIVLR